MLKVSRMVIHDAQTCETHVVLDTSVHVRRCFKLDDEMEPRAYEQLTARTANLMVGDVIRQANGFELLPEKHEVI